MEAPVTPTLRGKSAELASIHHKPNTLNIWMFLCFTCIFSVNANYALSSLNQMRLLLTAQLGWEEGSSQ